MKGPHASWTAIARARAEPIVLAGRVEWVIEIERKRLRRELTDQEWGCLFAAQTLTSGTDIYFRYRRLLRERGLE